MVQHVVYHSKAKKQTKNSLWRNRLFTKYLNEYLNGQPSLRSARNVRTKNRRKIFYARLRGEKILKGKRRAFLAALFLSAHFACLIARRGYGFPPSYMFFRHFRALLWCKGECQRHFTPHLHRNKCAEMLNRKNSLRRGEGVCVVGGVFF